VIPPKSSNRRVRIRKSEKRLQTAGEADKPEESNPFRPRALKQASEETRSLYREEWVNRKKLYLLKFIGHISPRPQIFAVGKF